MSTHLPTVMASELTGADWFKSQYSNGGGNCVEAADLTQVVALRDSKVPAGTALLFSRDSFATFVEGVRSGAHDAA